MTRKLLITISLVVVSALSLYSQEPSTVKAFIPAYPPLGRIAGLKGVVEIEVIVDAQGKVVSMLPPKLDSGLKQFRIYSESIARKWQFSSGSKTPLTIRFVYELLPNSTSFENLYSEFIAPRTVVIRSTPGNLQAVDEGNQTGVNIVKD